MSSTKATCRYFITGRRLGRSTGEFFRFTWRAKQWQPMRFKHSWLTGDFLRFTWREKQCWPMIVDHSWGSLGAQNNDSQSRAETTRASEIVGLTWSRNITWWLLNNVRKWDFLIYPCFCNNRSFPVRRLAHVRDEIITNYLSSTSMLKDVLDSALHLIEDGNCNHVEIETLGLFGGCAVAVDDSWSTRLWSRLDNWADWKRCYHGRVRANAFQIRGAFLVGWNKRLLSWGLGQKLRAPKYQFCLFWCNLR